jgi:hypothetical protein
MQAALARPKEKSGFQAALFIETFCVQAQLVFLLTLRGKHDFSRCF